MRPSYVIFALSTLLPFSCSSTSEAVEPDGLASDTPPAQELEVTAVPTRAAAPTVAPVSAAPAVQDSLDRAQLREERRKTLAQEYLSRGQRELDRLDYDAAMTSFAAALDLDPTSESARELLGRVRALMGDRFASAADTLQDETDRAMVKRAQARLQVNEFLRQGDTAAAEGDYAGAIQSYRQAEAILRWHPMIASDSLDERIVRGKIEDAGLRLEQQRTEELREQAARAEEQRQAAEQAAAARREQKLKEYYQLANQAFVNDRFEEAERWTRLILLEDPGNEAATALLSTARDARHQEIDEDHRKHYREQWLRTFEELDTMNVPQTEPIKYSAERWKKVRARQPLTHGTADPRASAERAVVMARLEELQFDPNFGGPDGEGTPLEEVATYLQALTGVNFWISNAVRDDLDEEETSIVLDVPERSVRKVLDLISATSESLRWKIEDGVVKFVTADELTGGQVLMTYSVQDLIHAIPDYPGREINIAPSGGLIPLDEDLEEREANVVTLSSLEELIRNNIDTESWDADPANSIRTTEVGQLVVNQTPEVQEKIAAPAGRPARSDRHHGRHPGALHEGRGQLPRGYRRRLPRSRSAGPRRERLRLQRLRRRVDPERPR